MAQMGAPVKYTKKFMDDISVKLNKYVEDTEIPIIAEFCYLNKIRKQRIYEFDKVNENISDSIKNCIDKKEAQLEKLGLLNIVNSTIAIFSLKQLGWRDRHDISVSEAPTVIEEDI